MFKSIVNNFHKAKSAVIVQNLLEHYQQNSIGFQDIDPASEANTLVQCAFDVFPDVFGKRFGVRPHKCSLAIMALSLGVEYACKRKNFNHFVAYNTAMTNLINEASVNAAFYGFTSADEQLFEMAMENAMRNAKDTFGEILDRSAEQMSGFVK